jgi:large subunit ribosomal protein L9
MKVILLDDVAKVGRRGEVRDVSDGYARNYLIPKKLALTATPGNLKNLTQIKTQQDTKAQRVKDDAEASRARIEGLVFEVVRQASDEGKLFGSVTAQDVVEFLSAQGVPVERRRVNMEEPIKALGETTVAIRLHPDVVAQLRVNVARQ